MRIAHLSDFHFAGPLYSNVDLYQDSRRTLRETHELLRWTFARTPKLTLASLGSRLLQTSKGELDAVGIRRLMALKSRVFRNPLTKRIRTWLWRDLEKQGVEHIIITGDLTAAARVSEFRSVSRSLATLAQHHGVSIVPGNHDLIVPLVYHAQLSHEERMRYFVAYLGRFIAAEELADYANAGVPLEAAAVAAGRTLEAAGVAADMEVVVATASAGETSVAVANSSGSARASAAPRRYPQLKILSDEVCCILLDSTYTEELSLEAGSLTTEQLRAVEEMMKLEAVQRRRLILALHHPVLPGPARVTTRFKKINRIFKSLEDSAITLLKESDALLDLARQHRQTLILHGHKHQEFLTEYQDMLVHCGGASLYPDVIKGRYPGYTIFEDHEDSWHYFRRQYPEI